MRNRIAALVVSILGASLGCGDSAGPPADPTAGIGVVTLTGSLQRSDTMNASYLPAEVFVFGTDTMFDAFITLFPQSGTIAGSTSRGRGAFPTFRPYAIELDLSGSGTPRPGTYSIDSASEATSPVGTPYATAAILDSLGLATFPTLLSDTANVHQPSAFLDAVSGHVTIDRVDATSYAGSFTFLAKDETGRSVQATGQFNAKLLAPPGLARAATSPPPPSSRAPR